MNIKLKTIQAKFSTLKKHLTIIDYIILIVLLFGFIFFFFILRRENAFITLKIKVTDPDVQSMNTQPLNEYALSFQQGDTELNELGQTISEVLQIDSYRTSAYQIVTYLNIRTKANYNPRKNQYYVRGKPVVFGQPMTFTLHNVKFEGVIVDFPGFQDVKGKQQEILRVKTQLRNDSREYSDVSGVPNYYANAVKIGDVVTNSKGIVLAKIVAIDVVPAKRTIITNGSSITIDDRELKDIYYTIDLTVQKIGNRIFMFDYLPVLVGDTVPINLPTISVWPTIISIAS